VAQALPYLSSNKNVGKLFEKILSAQKPSTFTHNYLQKVIGLTGTNDRPLISLLRSLGFLDSANVPTDTYDLLKNPNSAKAAIAAGIQKAYRELFAANEKANELVGGELRGLISQVSGADEGMVERIGNTFAALVKQGNFSGGTLETHDAKGKSGKPEGAIQSAKEQQQQGGAEGLRPEFHYDIEIHLPGNGSEETYINIFNAIRRTFK
jgi:hypothetical protein